MVLLLITVVSVCASPFLLIGYLVAVYRAQKSVKPA
jgi:hypothetical protein